MHDDRATLQRVEILAQAMHHVGRQLPKGSAPLCSFLGARGERHRNGLLIIGRATNEWDPVWTVEEAVDLERARAIAKTAYRADSPCPLDWITYMWRKLPGQRYATSSSSFWRAVKRMLENVDADATLDPKWSGRLAWTNLYKIAPASGGNPDKRLQQLQRTHCEQILIEEVEAFSPSRVLFMTGLDWAKPFLAPLQIEFAATGKGHAQAVGKLPTGARVVVATHPQGKRTGEWLPEVAEAL